MNESLELVALVGEETRQIAVSAAMMEGAASLFEKMDADMDKGWKLGRYFLPSPNRVQRCQIVADRLLTALHTENPASQSLMAAYILQRLPGVKTVVLNVEGEAEETVFYNLDDALIVGND